MQKYTYSSDITIWDTLRGFRKAFIRELKIVLILALIAFILLLISAYATRTPSYREYHTYASGEVVSGRSNR